MKNFDRFLRFEMLIGKENLIKLSAKHVAIFGLGGVGSYVAEALARSGIGSLTIVDYDKVDITNINRQLIAVSSSICENKTSAAANRLADINPELNINLVNKKIDAENIPSIFNDKKIDYAADCIDMVNSKTALIVYCYENAVPIISSMGMACKLSPLDIRVDLLNKTHTCPLAKSMRKQLKAYGIDDIKCVFSIEKPAKNQSEIYESGKRINGSSAFVPAAAGLIIASEIIKDLLES